MPLLRSVGASRPEEPTTPTPEPPPPPRRYEQPYVSWTPNGGPEMLLITGSDVVALAGIMGMGMPGEERHETPLAHGGFVLTHRRATGGEIMLPVKVARSSNETLSTFTAKRRELYRAFDPRRGPGLLTWGMPDGSRRQLRCQYVGGLESPQDGEQGAVLWAHHQIILRAEDPYWLGEERVVNFHVGPGENFYPVPLTISPSITTGDSTVTIDGEVEVWPVLEMDGPMTTAKFGNRDTGQELQLTPNLSAGQSLTVRMDPMTPPEQQFVRGTINVWGQVAGDFPTFWALKPGSNRVTVLAGGTTSQSGVRLRYRVRYLSA